METDVDAVPDPIKAFTPTMEVQDEFDILRVARKSLGGEALRPIEIDMDILADAYPREGSFLASTTENSGAFANLPAPTTPSKASVVSDSPRFASGRKTPSRKFFRSDHEREYARTLMKELVQIYILQGVHGKDAFRQALNETRRRIHVRRGEAAPSPPAVLSPVHESPYPKLSPERNANPVIERIASAVADSVADLSSPTKSPSRRPPVAPRTPSRVQSMVAAIQASTPSKPVVAESARKTPSSSRVKAVAEAIEAKTPKSVLSFSPLRSSDEFEPDYAQEPELGNPSPPKPRKTASPKKASEAEQTSPKRKRSLEKTPLKSAVEDEVVRTSSRLRKPVEETPPSKRKNEEIVEKVSTSRRGKKVVEAAIERADSPPAEKRTRRVAAIAAAEEIEDNASPKRARRKEVVEPEAEKKVTVRKKAAAKAPPSAARKRKTPALTTIPEDEAVVVPVRAARKAKPSAN